MSPAAKAWIVVGLGVIGYDALCPRGQTMSEGMDRGLAKRPILTLAGWALLNLHLLNLSERVYVTKNIHLDPISGISALMGRGKDRLASAYGVIFPFWS